MPRDARLRILRIDQLRESHGGQCDQEASVDAAVLRCGVPEDRPDAQQNASHGAAGKPDASNPDAGNLDASELSSQSVPRCS